MRLGTNVQSNESFMGSNETKRGAAREIILQSVLDLIAREGLDAVTHRSAAEASCVSPGTVTYHFPSRESLIDAAFSKYVADYQASLNQAIASQPIASRDDLLNFLVGTTGLSPEALSLASIEAELALLSHRTGRLTSALQAWQRAMEPILSDVLERIGVARPVEAARSLVAICRGTEFEVMARCAAISADTLRARLDAALRGLPEG